MNSESFSVFTTWGGVGAGDVLNPTDPKDDLSLVLQEHHLHLTISVGDC